MKFKTKHASREVSVWGPDADGDMTLEVETDMGHSAHVYLNPEERRILALALLEPDIPDWAVTAIREAKS